MFAFHYDDAEQGQSYGFRRASEVILKDIGK